MWVVTLLSYLERDSASPQVVNCRVGKVWHWLRTHNRIDVQTLSTSHLFTDVVKREVEVEVVVT